MTDTQIQSDNQTLFELCKEVYERFPEWGNTGKLYSNDWKGEIDSFQSDSGILRQSDMICPLYTSDYLLPKLLAVTTVRLYLNSELRYDLMYEPVKPDYNNYSSDLIVKTLLKLVIALDDAGVKL